MNAENLTEAELRALVAREMEPAREADRLAQQYQKRCREVHGTAAADDGESGTCAHDT